MSKKKKPKSITYKKKKVVTRTSKKKVPKGTSPKDPVKKVLNWKGESVNSVHNAFPEWGEKFFKLFPIHKTIYHTCAAMGISRHTVTKYKTHCKKFREMFYDAKEDLTDMIEESGMNRAIHGHEKLILHEGKPVMVKLPGMTKAAPLWEKKYETSLTIFMLKGRRRDEYYPEMKSGGGTNDDKANAVLQVIQEIKNVMAPKGGF